MLDVLAYGALGLAKQLRELLLVESDGLIFQAHVELRAAVLALVDEELVHAHLGAFRSSTSVTDIRGAERRSYSYRPRILDAI